jgi:hypothetical protein
MGCRRADLPSIDYELPLSVVGEQNADALKNLDLRVSNIFNRSDAFSSVRPGIGGEQNHVRISLDITSNVVVFVLSILVSIESS